MLVTQLTPKGKSQTIVEIDYDQTIVLPNKKLLLYDIRENAELSADVWEVLLKDLQSDALKKCGSLLKDMDYTEQGLALRLQRSGYPDSIVQEVIKWMKEAGYLDDRRYAENYLHCHMQDRSRFRMRMELREKGIPDSVLDEVYNAWEMELADEIDAAETGQIRAIMRKRGYQPDAADLLQQQKMISFLQNKGYSSDIIRTAMAGAQGDEDSPRNGDGLHAQHETASNEMNHEMSRFCTCLDT